MDQESFRQLLSLPSSSSRTTGPTSKTVVQASKAPAAVFKPRKISKKPPNKGGDEEEEETDKKDKKKEAGYRDRAAERRDGINDFAQVEAILHDFEERNSAVDKKELDEQRKYLGGDSTHTVLVKGLDFALLEQNQARLTESQNEGLDDVLEETFKSVSTNPKKRTRQDIVADLKSKREATTAEGAAMDVDRAEEQTAAAKTIERAKKMGKFKPIGAPAVTATTTSEGKGERRKKKKQKVVVDAPAAEATSTTAATATKGKPPKQAPAPTADDPTTIAQTTQEAQPTASSSSTNPSAPVPVPIPEPESLDDDFDIFAGAGDYEGFDFGDDDDDYEAESKVKAQNAESSSSAAPPVALTSNTNWFGEPLILDPPETTSAPAADPTQALPHPRSPSGKERERDPSPDPPDLPTKLTALTSSALPSIKEFLAADAQISAAEKKRLKKLEKKKGGGGTGEGGGGGGGSSGAKKSLSAQAKLDRDHQKITSFMNK